MKSFFGVNKNNKIKDAPQVVNLSKNSCFATFLVVIDQGIMEENEVEF